MLIAILMESDTRLSDELLEAIIDQVSVELIAIFFLSFSELFEVSIMTCSTCRHLLMLMLIRMEESARKSGRLL